jgi:hypothetical protein
MPIRPENAHRYPRNWREISARIRFDRAGGRCECSGQCGLTHPGGRCPALHDQPHPDTGSEVCLTTAHLNHQPEDVREDNLLAACQRCHLRIDAGHHRVTRSMTLAARAAAAGQLALEAVAVLAVPVEPPPAAAQPAAAAVTYDVHDVHDVPLPLELLPPDQPPTCPEAPHMARITATIKPIHDDNSVCTHPVTSTGKSRDAASGCTGRAAYTASCSAGDWTETRRTKAELEYLRDTHFRTHLTKPAAAAPATV